MNSHFYSIHLTVDITSGYLIGQSRNVSNNPPSSIEQLYLGVRQLIYDEIMSTKLGLLIHDELKGPFSRK